MTPQVYDRSVLISTPGDDFIRLVSALDFGANLGYGRPEVVGMAPAVRDSIMANPAYRIPGHRWPLLVGDETIHPLCFAFISGAREP